MTDWSRQSSSRSQSTPMMSQSSNQSLSKEDMKKIKTRGSELVRKVFQFVAKNYLENNRKIGWKQKCEQFINDGYEDLNQAKIVRVSDLITQYGMKGDESIYLYLELWREFRKQQKDKTLFYPTFDEIQSIPKQSLNDLVNQPAEIKFKSSKRREDLELNLIILFGPTNFGKSTFISACINFIRGLEYHSLLRYTVDKNERVVRIDDGNQQYCFIKAESFTNPSENREIATNLRKVLQTERSGRQLASFSILYFILSTQTRVGMAEKYCVQKILEIVPKTMKKFYIVGTFCTSDKANMVIFTGDQSPAHQLHEFIQKHAQEDKQYIFNNKLLSYEYKKRKQNQGNNQVQSSNHLQNQEEQSQQQQQLQQQEQQQEQQQQQQQEQVNQENEQQPNQNQLNQDQQSEVQSCILDLSLENVDMTYIYWVRNQKNYDNLSKELKSQEASTICQNEFDQFIKHLENLEQNEQTFTKLMKEKKEILQLQQKITKNMEELQTLRTESQNFYIKIQTVRIQNPTNIAYANNVHILFCKQCEQVCHKTCRSTNPENIHECQRFKKGFCKSCYKNKSQHCKPIKHELVKMISVQTDIETSKLELDIIFLQTKEKQKEKDFKIKEIRQSQSEVFQRNGMYIKNVKEFKQEIQQQVNQLHDQNQRISGDQQNEIKPQIKGYLQLDFEIYKKYLETVQLNEEGQLYYGVINDILRL